MTWREFHSTKGVGDIAWYVHEAEVYKFTYIYIYISNNENIFI